MLFVFCFYRVTLGLTPAICQYTIKNKIILILILRAAELILKSLAVDHRVSPGRGVENIRALALCAPTVVQGRKRPGGGSHGLG